MEREYILWASEYSDSGFSATQKEEYTSFNQLCDKGHKLRYKKWCPVEEREVQWSEIKKGYEITKNNYVVLEKEEIENIKLKTTNTVEVKEFIKSEEFDPIFIEKNYYVGPYPGKKKTEASIKAYSLLVKILNETKKIAIGKVALREKEHLVALRAYQRGLVMHQLKYLDEIRAMDEIGNLDSMQKIDSKELSLGKTLVENLTTERFDPGQYSDSYAKELEKLIEAKSKGQKVVPEQVEEELEETTDIIEALKAFLLRYQDCISCGHRTEFTCIKCGYCYSCHWKREQAEAVELRNNLKDFYTSLSKSSNKNNEKQKIQQDATRDIDQRWEGWV
jgi:DNA end-binding protein Ku